MSDHVKQIQQMFPTERYKRFWYPTRPLFTLLIGLCIASLGFIGIIPLSWAMWLAAAFALDDLPLTPITSMLTAVNNFLEGRKKLKAIVMITALSLALIGGGLLGCFILAQMPIAVKLIADYIALSNCSPLLISLGALLGGYLAHATHKISSFTGFSLGIALAAFIPFALPLSVEVIFLSIAVCTFLTSVITKQALRAYFKYFYGESNADGYECARSPVAQKTFISEQAKKFEVTPKELKILATTCKERVTKIKREATFYQEYVGGRNYLSNSFKDIYHGLMNPKLSKDDIAAVKKLIAKSQLPDDLQEDYEKRKEKTASIDHHFTFGTFFQQGLSQRILGHQIKIAEGGNLDEQIRWPFLRQSS